MRKSSIVACASLWAVAGAAFGQAAAAPPAPPLEAYGRLPWLEEMQISPDGKHLAFVRTDGDERLLVIEDIAAHKLDTGVKLGKTKLRGLSWADDAHLLITTSTTARFNDVDGPKREWFIASVFDTASRRLDRLTAGPGAMDVLVADPVVRRIDGKTYVFLQTPRFEHGQVIGLYRIDLASRNGIVVEAGHEDTNGWFVGQDGRALAETRFVAASGRWQLLIRGPAGWIVSKTLSTPIDPPSLLGYAKDGRSLLVNTVEDSKSMFHTVSMGDGAWGEGEPDISDALFFDDETHALIGGVDLEGDVRRVDFFEPRIDAIWKAIEKAYPAERVTPVSWSRDHRKVVVLVDGARDGYAYALDDLDAKSGDWLGGVYPDVPPELIAQPEPFSYKAADGLDIPAYLTLPPGRPRRNLPLIVMPHGGPALRDSTSFDWLREALVSRGYAVLQPNFRGSGGYRNGLLEAGYGQWGRKMQTDLSDGVRHLGSQGVIDAKRVCIFGGSYGGYAALAGAALDPGVYRCAADLAGPADLRLMLQQVQIATGQRNSDTLRYWDRFMGATGPNDPVLDGISPIRFAAKVEIPILLVHGKDDTVVDYTQSLVMADALKRAGKPFTFVTLDGEDHWLSRSETRLKLLQAVMDFLLKNNPPGQGG